MPLYHVSVLLSGRFSRVHWQLGAKPISSFRISTRLTCQWRPISTYGVVKYQTVVAVAVRIRTLSGQWL